MKGFRRFGIALAAVGAIACGSDSTGPSNLEASAALKSLLLGLAQIGSDGTTAAIVDPGPFNAIAPFLNQVTVNIDGSAQTMFSLGLRETFPAGTCEETIFGDIIPADPGVCTPPELGLAVMLWQSHSESEVPDRLAVLVGDEGTSNFDFNIDSPTLPAVGIYAEGRDNLWISESGTLTSSVSATSQNCSVTLPPYAKSGVCHIATFDEQGSIVLGSFDINGGASTTNTKTLTIPRQTLHGLWLEISEVQPIGLTASRVVPRLAPLAFVKRLTSR
ncbi:MAG TPA: hypothetical protein VJ865_16135 [Gemmatimonadaceae bacterium]|nr:hypothetical protein [Gemmatimonadaceae bacterium]